MIEHLKSSYEKLPNGEIKRMTVVQRGKELDYLGMNFNFQGKGKVKTPCMNISQRS